MVKTLITLPHNFTDDNANGNTVNFTGMDLDDNFNACKTEVERLDNLLNEKIASLTSSKIIIADKINLDDIDDNLYSINSRYYDVTGQGYSLVDGLTIRVRLTIDHTFQPKANPVLKLDGNSYKYIVYHNQTSLEVGTEEIIYHIDGNSFSSGINTFTYNANHDCWIWKGQVASGMLIPMSYQNRKIPTRLIAGWISVVEPYIEIDSSYIDEHPYFIDWYNNAKYVNFSIGGLTNDNNSHKYNGGMVGSNAGQNGVKGDYTIKDYNQGGEYFVDDFSNRYTLTHTTENGTVTPSPELLKYTGITVPTTLITYTPPQPVLKATLSEEIETFITKRFGVDWWLKT